MSLDHQITAVPRPKMDTPTGLFTWACSCGRISNMIGSESDALRAGEAHAAAKLAAARPPVAVVVEVEERLTGMRQSRIITTGVALDFTLSGIYVSADGAQPVARIDVPVTIRARIA